jgi:hypothetical protein
MNNFIDGWFIKDLSICDRIIKSFNESDDKGEGLVNMGGISQVNKSLKTSTEVCLSEIKDQDLIAEYHKELQAVLENYIDKYKYCNYYAPFAIVADVNIQHYKPNEGFYGWHTERLSANYPSSTRHLVFMTYLNDVEDGGETEFYHQELKVKPQKGYTLIWPADWTHTHRGITSPTQDKYIVTGWYNYIEKNIVINES